jgi:hypothetical protein
MIINIKYCIVDLNKKLKKIYLVFIIKTKKNLIIKTKSISFTISIIILTIF